MLERDDIVATKLLPPRRRSILLRERLTSKLRDGLTGKLTVVMADAGYGKTTLVMSLAEVCPELNFCWYRIDAADRSPGIFLKYLIEAVHSRCPQFGAGVSLLLDTGLSSVREIERAVVAFVNDFVVHVSDFVVLVLDDLHFVDDSSLIGHFLARLLELLPDNLHIIVTSRTKPALPLSALMARGEVNIIGGNELRFNDGEIDELMRNNTEARLDDGEIDHIKKISEGWISAIVLILGIIRHMDTDTRLSYIKHFKGAPDVFNFLAHEIFDRQTHEMQDFLLKTAILDILDFSVIDDMLDKENTPNLLEQLYKGNFLVHCIDEQSKQYRFHSLMKAFLQEKLVSTYSKPLIKELHRKAGVLYRSRNAAAQAIEHFLAAEDYDEAVPMVIRYLPSLITKLHLETADLLVSRIPARVINKDYSLLIEIGELRRHQGRIDEAIDIYRTCVGVAEDLGDESRMAEALFWLATTAFEYSDPNAILPDTMARLATLNSSDARINLKLINSCVYLIDSDLSGAYKIVVDAITNATGNEKKYPQCLSMLQALCFGLGKFVEAIGYFYKEYQVLKRRGHIEKASDMLAVDNSVWIASVCYYCMGDALELESLVERFTADADVQTLVKVSPVIDLIRSFILIIRHDYAGSLEHLRRSALFATSKKRMSAFAVNEETSMVLRRELAHVYMRRGEYGYARACIERNMRIELYKKRLDFHHLINTDLAELVIAEGSPESALHLLTGALEYQKKTERPFEIIRTLALLTRLNIAIGSENKASHCFNEALEVAVEHDYEYQAVRELSFNEALPLLRAAINRGAVFRSFIEKSFSAFGPSMLKNIMSVKPQIVIGNTAPSRSNCSLRLSTFGGFHAELDGSPIKNWRKNKAKGLLALLLVAEGKPLPRERLVELLWPDADIIDGRNNLRNTIFALKKALCKAEEVVQIDRDSMRLIMENCTWDVPEFHSLLDDVKKAGHPDANTRSVQIEQLLHSLNDVYRGEFLPELLFADMFIERRHRYREQYCDALVTLAEKARGIGNNELAFTCFRHTLDTDSCIERAHIGLMELYSSIGDREAALRQYRACSDSLEHELGVSPSEGAVLLFERLLGEIGHITNAAAGMN